MMKLTFSIPARRMVSRAFFTIEYFARAPA
jgi:hypothetical protein